MILPVPPVMAEIRSAFREFFARSQGSGVLSLKRGLSFRNLSSKNSIALRSPDALALVGDVIDHDVVADLVRRGVEDPAGIQAGKLVDETAAIKIGAEHEGVDLDAALRAAPDLFQRLLHDPLVQKRGAPAAVQPAAARKRMA